MKTYSIIFLILSVSIFGCDKKIKEYSDIKVEDNNGETLALTTLEGEWIVYAFLSPECPLSENYTRTLMQFQDSLQEKHVDFYYVFPGIFYPKQTYSGFCRKLWNAIGSLSLRQRVFATRLLRCKHDTGSILNR